VTSAAAAIGPKAPTVSRMLPATPPTPSTARHVVREVALPLGLVDTKVCAIADLVGAQAGLAP
jgi:hypothetical protein